MFTDLRTFLYVKLFYSFHVPNGKTDGVTSFALAASLSNVIDEELKVSLPVSTTSKFGEKEMSSRTGLFGARVICRIAGNSEHGGEI